ncbi:MAG: CheR family methyltransferase [bacterium]
MSDELTETDFQFIRNWLRVHVGQDLGHDKQYLVKVALSEMMVRYQLPSIRQTVQRLEALAPASAMFDVQFAHDPASPARRFVQDMIDALMVGETYFFRRSSTFEDLRRFVFPTLIEKRQSQQRLRVWSAACSFGQEPYSIAMTLANYFPDVYRAWDVVIVASDISHKAIEKAKAGRFTEWETSRGLESEMRERYFTKDGDSWVARDEIRQPIRFHHFNLVSSNTTVPYRPFDLVLLRNVLIYFDMEKKRQILSKIRSDVQDDGFLLLGESETLLGLDSHFQISSHASALCEPK